MMSQYNLTKLNIPELMDRISESLSGKIDITVEALQVKIFMHVHIHNLNDACTCIYYPYLLKLEQ